MQKIKNHITKMKQDTNFSAAWKQVVGSRTTATRQTKQSILNSMLRAFLFLTLMVMGINASASVLPAKFGKTLTIDQWGNISADQFEGFSDNATVVFEYQATQASDKTGHISSFGHGEGDEATYLFYGDIAPANAGYNRLVKKISDIKTAFTDENAVNGSGKHGLTFNTWGDIVSDKTVTVYEDGVGIPAEQGHWNSATNTYTWTLNYSNLMPIYVFSNGELANYNQIRLNFTWTGDGDYNNAFRMLFQDKDGNTLGSQITFGSAGQKDIIFATHSSTNSIDLSKVAKILLGGASASGSVTIDPASVKLVGAHTVTFFANDNNMGSVSASVGENTINSGDKVSDNASVTFTATPTGSNLFWRWVHDDQYDYNSSSKNVTITNDYTLKAQFHAGIHVRAYTNNANFGTINIRRNGQDATEWHVTPWPDKFTFIATPVGNSTFDGWYDNVECNGDPVSTLLEYDKTDFADRDVNLWAHFTEGSASDAVKADFANRGIDSGINWSNVTGDDGDKQLVFRTKESSYNAYTIFAFPGESNNNVTNSADNYSGIVLSANGEPFRILVYYDGGQATQEVTTTYDFKQYRYTWSELGVPANKVSTIRTVRFAGSSKTTGDDRYSTFRNTYLVKKELKLYDLSTFPTTGGGANVKSVVKNGDGTVTMTTQKNSNNVIKIMDVTHGDALQYSGMRFDTKGTRFRVIVKTSDGKTFVAFVDNSNSNDYKTQHFQWSDFKIQWGNTPMTEEDVANINQIMIGGDDDNPDATDDQFTIRHIWFDDINDYDHTFVCYGEEGGNYNWGNQHYTYTLNDATAEFTNITGASRYGENHSIKLDNNAQIVFTVPEGLKYTGLKLIFGDGTSKVLDGVDAREYTYTNTSGSTQNIAKVEFKTATTQPAGYQKINVTFADASEDREFIVYAPAGISGNVPVLFSLHGTGNDYTGYGVQNYNSLADAEKFIVVYPRGTEFHFPVFGATARGWHSDGTYNKDTKFFEDIINWLKNNSSTKYGCTINEQRIYMTGFSNGGMMTYSTAYASDKFAAFSSISGIQMNEFHLQHFGPQAWHEDKYKLTPFMHIHGTKDDFVKYTLVPTIVDNMINRNGLDPNVTTYTDDNGGSYWVDHNPYYERTGLKRTTYTSTINDKIKFVYYEIGSGMTAADTGMGHNAGCDIDDNNDGNYTPSTTIMWNFMKQYKLSDRADASKTVFKPNLENYSSTVDPGTHAIVSDASNHGWTMYSGKILAQYGEQRKSTSDKQNVYHTIQFKDGNHNIKFNATCTNPKTRWVTARLERLATIDANGEPQPLPSIKTVFEKNYTINEPVSLNFYFTDEGLCEYRLTFLVGGEDKLDEDDFYESGFPKDPVVISGVSISAGNDTETGTVFNPPVSTDFTGYFNYHNRLVAQWNFDMADNNRCNLAALESNKTLWEADYRGATADHNFGTIVYSYTGALSNQELTYDGTHLIPVAAGLKFLDVTEGSKKVKIQATVHNGKVEKIQLVLEPNTRMYIPYVRNSYRNDPGSTYTPYDISTKGYHPELMTSDWMDCIHHINRDIVYFASSPDIWGAINNHVYEDDVLSDSKELFNSGGYDFVDGKTWAKCNFCGTQGKPCIVTIKTKTTFDRIGVNRNLIYSFYTENISADTGYDRPFSGLRVIGTPRGAKIADVGATYASYPNAIAMTYGGWKYNNNQYKAYDGTDIDDKWSELTVYGEYADINYGNNNENLQYDKVPIATDGFPVFSSLPQPAHSENLNPTKTNDGLDNSSKSYHDANNGVFYLSKNDGGTYDDIVNLTPWSLPARGSHAKFEPTLPGVLNVHILQEKGYDYYIADEFGHLVKENVFTKSGTGQTVTNNNGHFSITRSDNVKYSFDVYPGKTYYLFSNTGKMAIAGFNFEPYVYRKYHSIDDVPDTEYNPAEAWEMDRDNVTLNTAKLREKDESENPVGYVSPASLLWDNWSENAYWYSNQTANFHDDDHSEWEAAKHTQTQYKGESDLKNEPMTLDNRAVHVKYTRSFAKDKWSTICLPFSMNNLQLQEQFGDGVKVVLMRDVQEYGKNGYTKTTANFIYHMNQDIIAGYPYLVYTTKENVWQIEANVYVSEEKNDGTYSAGGVKANAPSLVTINGVGQNTVTHPGSVYLVNDKPYYLDDDTYDYDGLKCYDFKGNFTTESLPKGSYVVATDGKLTRLPQTQQAAPFRAFLKYDQTKETDSQFHARDRVIEAVNYGELAYDGNEIVGIEDILLQSGIVGAKTDVYSINGQMVRKHTDNLQGLKKGLYIVNGKKYFVK